MAHNTITKMKTNIPDIIPTTIGRNFFPQKAIRGPVTIRIIAQTQ